MTVKESFDKAIKKSLGGKENEYYSSDRVLPEKYYMYYPKDKWDKYLEDMSPDDRNAYNNGGGKELEERCNDAGIWMPPKMASYASSSRFVYDLLKGTDVIFEQKLPTSVPHSTSNMDAFYLSRNIFIEAKCHEIYDSPSPKYKIAFNRFYNMLAARTGFSYQSTAEINDSEIYFFLDDTPVIQFDLKQIIAHTLGIANACRLGVKIGKQRIKLNLDSRISLIYLLFNPKSLRIYLSDAEWTEIQSCYSSEINFIKDNLGFFRQMFEVSLEYVGFTPTMAIELAERYDFKLADQNNYMEVIHGVG